MFLLYLLVSSQQAKSHISFLFVFIFEILWFLSYNIYVCFSGACQKGSGRSNPSSRRQFCPHRSSDLFRERYLKRETQRDRERDRGSVEQGIYIDRVGGRERRRWRERVRGRKRGLRGTGREENIKIDVKTGLDLVNLVLI